MNFFGKIEQYILEIRVGYIVFVYLGLLKYVAALYLTFFTHLQFKLSVKENL